MDRLTGSSGSFAAIDSGVLAQPASKNPHITTMAAPDPRIDLRRVRAVSPQKRPIAVFAGGPTEADWHIIPDRSWALELSERLRSGARQPVAERGQHVQPVRQMRDRHGRK